MIEPVTSRGQILQRSDTFFAPATIETMFWRPRFIVNTPLMQHVPFLFWLVGAVRPRSAAVFGAGNGVALFALCQAMDKLNIAGRCLGIGFWTEDDGTKEDTVPVTLRDHANQLYDDIVDWRCATSPRDALAAIAPGSLDLLFIDACDLRNSQLPSPEEWLKVLHQDGVLVIHGQPSSGQGWAGIVQALSDARPVISFPDEQGLAVLPLSDNQPARLQTLVDISDHGVLPGEIGLFFRRLGQGHLAVARQIDVSLQNQELTSTLSTAQQERDDALNSGAEMREAYNLRSRKLADLQEALFDRDNRLAGIEPQLETAQQEITRLQAELDKSHQSAASAQAALEQERNTRFSETAALVAQMEAARLQAKTRTEADATQAQTQITSLQQELNKSRQSISAAKTALEQERNTHFSETAALTLRLEALLGEHKKAEAASAAKLQKLLRENKRLGSKNTALTRRVDELMSSTSWRITAPMRKVKSALRRP